MDHKIREMQERLDKVGTGRPFVPAKVLVDYSKMSARLPQPPKRQYEFTGHPNPSLALPEAKSIPVSAIAYQAKPEALPTPPAKSSLSSVPPVPVEKPYPSVESVPTSIHSTVSDTVESPRPARYSPHTAPQSKGRSSLILWVWMALLVAFVIGQLIWVMS